MAVGDTYDLDKDGNPIIRNKTFKKNVKTPSVKPHVPAGFRPNENSIAAEAGFTPNENSVAADAGFRPPVDEINLPVPETTPSPEEPVRDAANSNITATPSFIGPVNPAQISVPTVDPNERVTGPNGMTPDMYRSIWHPQNHGARSHTGVSLQIADARDWMASYYRSPKFKERFNRMINDGTYKPSSLSLMRHILEPGQIMATRIENMSMYPATSSNPIVRALQSRNSGSRLYQGLGIAIIDTKEDKERNYLGITNPGATAVHEFAHKNQDMLLSPKQASRIKQGIQTNSEAGLSEHVRKPTEARADIQGLRYMAARLGIYDARTQTFTREHLQRLFREISHADQPAMPYLYRLSDNYDDETIIWMMNNLAQNDSKEGPSNPIPDNYA